MSLLTGLLNANTSVLDEVPTSTTERTVTAISRREQSSPSPSRSPWPRQARLYNISNFGDTNACYADVNEGDERLFFLTVFNNRLSAKYDDLFGAVAERTIDNEAEVLQILGQTISYNMMGCQTFRTLTIS